MHRRLIIMGYTRVEAGNLLAKLVGLEVTKSGWTIDQLVHLIFLQYLRIES